MTKNALKAQASIKSLEAQLRSLSKAAATAKGGDALKKFNVGDQLKIAKAAANAQGQSAARQAAAQAKTARAAKAEASRIANFRQSQADSGIGHMLSGAGGAAVATAAAAAVAAAAIAAAVAVGKIAIAFSEAAIAAAVFQQRSIQALELLIGSGGVAVTQFNDLRHEAQALGLDVLDTQKSFQKLLASQFEIGKAREIIRMGADLQAIGATGEEVSRVLLAMTQIKAKGRLQAQEMLQLQEAGVSAELVYKALGERLGKTKDELKQLQEKGKIGGTDAIESIIEAVRHKTGAENTGDAGKKFANNTLAGMKGQFDAGIQNIFIDIGNAIEPTLVPLAQKIVDLFESIVNDPDVQAFGTHLLREFQYFEAWVSENWPEIKSTIIGGLEGIMTVVRLTVDAIDVLAGQWEEWRLVGIGLGLMLGLVALAVSLFVGGAMIAIGVILGVVGALAYAAGWIYENFTKIPGIIGGVFADAGMWLWNAGKAIVQGLIDGVMSMFGALATTSSELAGQASGPFVAEMAIQSPSKLFEEYGVYTVQGYIEGVAANENAVAGVTADMAGAAVRGVESTPDDAADSGATGSGGGITLYVDKVMANSEAEGRNAMRGMYSELEKILAEVA